MVPKPLPAVERMLRAALRVTITSYLEDLSTFEAMLNLGGEVRARSPRVSAELPVSRERFESSVPLVAVVQRKNVLVPGGTSAESSHRSTCSWPRPGVQPASR